MRRVSFAMLMTVAVAGVVMAQTAAPAWQSSVATAAKTPAEIKGLMTTIAAADQPAFAAETVKAIDKLPATPEQRAQATSTATRQLIGGADKGAKVDLIAQLFAAVPVANLAALAEGLIPSFNRTKNGMTKQDYNTIGKQILTKVAEAVATAEYPAARMSVALAVFRAGDDWTDEETLAMAKDVLPSGNVSAALVAQAAGEVAGGNYQSVEAMTGVSQVMTEQTRTLLSSRVNGSSAQASATANAATQSSSKSGEPQVPLATPPTLHSPIENASAGAEALLQVLGDQDVSPQGGVIRSGGSTASDSSPGGDLQQGGAGAPGDYVPPPPPPSPPPPPPPPPTPPPYQGQTF